VEDLLKMKVLRAIGIFLIVAGIVMIATGGFSFKQKKKLVDTNAVDISLKENKTVTWPWFAGGIAVVGGIAILLVTARKGNNSPGKNSVLVD
jgi:uncharacterized membrane protein YidH (DUF202 family)